MNTVTQLYDRSLRVELSKTAACVCGERSSPLLVEMELRFGCLVTKRTNFRDAPADPPGTQIDPCLFVDFRAIFSNTCAVSGEGGSIDYSDKPVINLRPYVPSWCRIDFVHNQWTCQFGYDRKKPGLN